MTTKNVINITVKVNGKDHTAAVEPRLLLVHFIREVLHHVCRPNRWARGEHHRGSSPERGTSSVTRRLQRKARIALRLLHAGDDHVHLRFTPKKSATD